MRKHHDNNYNVISWLTFHEQKECYLENVAGEWCNRKWISSTQSMSSFRPVTRILCGGRGEGCANEAKADPATEMYFLSSDPFI